MPETSKILILLNIKSKKITTSLQTRHSDYVIFLSLPLISTGMRDN